MTGNYLRFVRMRAQPPYPYSEQVILHCAIVQLFVGVSETEVIAWPDT